MPSDADNTLRQNLLEESKRIEEDGLLSSKGHYAAADWWRKVHLFVGVPTAILTGIAGIVIIAGPAEVQGISVDLLVGLLTIAGAVSTAILTFLGPERRSTAHQTAADRYNTLKARARRFYNIDMHRSFTTEQLSDRLESLSTRRDELNESSPLTPESAYEKGKKGIEAGQAKYEADSK
jgi:hypothetical protein